MFYNLLEGSANASSTYIMFGLIFVVIIGLMVWQSISGKKKQKEAQARVDALKVGDRVKTIGGICGFVAEINNNENTFVLETGLDDKKCYVKFDKGAIYQTAPAEGAAYAKPEEEKKEEVVEQPTEEVVTETVVEEKPAKPKRKKREEI
ncbi:MAG: preprotein translocase subunit YajC [Clostridia bacterium]|nr:preprotein translocase subunit YajC [Clostridia bacterium]